MGSFYEINDTLLINESQGFPSDILNIECHQKNPVTLKDVEDKVFHFKDKPTARAFQLDPIRVFFFERTKNDKWLAWGKVFIQSLTIEHKPRENSHGESAISFIPGDWVTSGTYKIVEIYDPEYQKIYTSHEAPKAWNYFADN